MITATRERRRQLERDNAKQSEFLAHVPQSQWSESMLTAEHPPITVLRSKRFLVQIFEEKGVGIRLSVCRTELGGGGRWVEGISWDELQTLKREAGYGNTFAVEIYPRDRDIVNVANMR